jgi:hypothetical protein
MKGIADAALADVAQDVLEEHAVEPADEGRAGAERHAVGEGRKQDGNKAGDGKAGHHGVADILLAHHAAIEQAEPRHRHHQDQRDRSQHPRSVAGIRRALLQYLAAAGGRTRILGKGGAAQSKPEKRDSQ